jgi:lipid-binding SYLF domain-containing protein
MIQSERTSRRALITLALALAVLTSPSRSAEAASGAELSRDARAALNRLTSTQRVARMLAPKAKAVLVFPNMVKAGFMFGGQIGEGALLSGGKTIAYYNSVAASYGFQAGAQKFGYALFFMNQAALDQLDATHGFEVGVGPSVVLVDEGMGKSTTSSTLTSDVYAFIFSQKGLMAGLGVQGSKITRIKK